MWLLISGITMFAKREHFNCLYWPVLNGNFMKGTQINTGISINVVSSKAGETRPKGCIGSNNVHFPFLWTGRLQWSLCKFNASFWGLFAFPHNLQNAHFENAMRHFEGTSRTGVLRLGTVAAKQKVSDYSHLLLDLHLGLQVLVCLELPRIRYEYVYITKRYVSTYSYNQTQKRQELFPVEQSSTNIQ